MAKSAIWLGTGCWHVEVGGYLAGEHEANRRGLKNEDTRLKNTVYQLGRCWILRRRRCAVGPTTCCAWGFWVVRSKIEQIILSLELEELLNEVVLEMQDE